LILVDTNVFVDLWTADPKWGAWSAEALASAADAGPLAINPIIYAELCLGFATEAELERVVGDTGIRCLELPYRAAWRAAQAFRAYRRRGGARSAPLPDFYIGAHALVDGIPLLTRDPARYRTYFPEVTLIEPESG
jgi:predicted nucleic acid-binding protein